MIRGKMVLGVFVFFSFANLGHAELIENTYNPLQYSSIILESEPFKRLHDGVDRVIALKVASAITGVSFCEFPKIANGIGGEWMKWIADHGLFDTKSDQNIAVIFAVGYLVSAGSMDKENVCRFVSEAWRP